MKCTLLNVMILETLVFGTACSSPEPPKLILTGSLQERGEDAQEGTSENESTVSATEEKQDASGSKVLGSNSLPGFDKIVISEGLAVATADTLLKLNLNSTIIVPKSSSIKFSATEPVPQGTIDQLEFAIPYKGGLTDNIVVVYRLEAVGNNAPVLGLIPLSMLKTNNEGGLVVFKSQGLGEYQIAETSDKIPDSLPKKDTIQPPTFQISGTMNYTNFYGIEPLGNFVALIGDTGLRIVDITNPAQPTQVGMLTNANGEFGAGRAIRSSGDLLVQTTIQGGFGAFNITDKAAPTFRDGIADAQGRDITLVGNYGFTANANGLTSFFYAAVMIPVSQLVQAGGCNGIEGDNQILVAACASNVIGYVTANLPSLSAFTIDTALGGRGVALAGGFAYVAGDDGLRIYNVINPAASTQVGKIAIPGALQVTVKDNLAVVLTATAAILVDISKKEAPALFNPSIMQPVSTGRRVKFLAPDKILILDSTGLKVGTIK